MENLELGGSPDEAEAAPAPARCIWKSQKKLVRKQQRATEHDVGATGTPPEEAEEDLVLEQWEHNSMLFLVNRSSLMVYSRDGEALHRWGEGDTDGAVVPEEEVGEEVPFKKGRAGTRIEGQGVGMREKYEEMGVDGYYEAEGDNYSNPHMDQIIEVLFKAYEAELLDFTRVLDVCAGHGEVSTVVKDLYPEAVVFGLDPYTYKGYERKIGQQCWQLSFEDIRKGKLMEQAGADPKSFSCIVSSFGLHLLEEKHTWGVISQLVELTDTVVIITPHKRPELDGVCGLVKCGEDITALTERGKSVRMKIYKVPVA